MNISNEQITKFQEIYKKNFGKEINQKEAYEKALKLLGLLSLIRNQNNFGGKNSQSKQTTKIIKKNTISLILT